VHQRLALAHKGRVGELRPHQLVMTATPIPRTLAMTEFADLDASVIDELPPGRKPVQTVAVSRARRDEVIQRIADACAAGRQAYWVCTLIEESDEVEAEAAEKTPPTSPRIAAAAHRPGPWARLKAAERAGRHAGLRGRQRRPAGGDHRDRGRCGRAQRQPDDHRESRAPRVWRSCTSCAGGSGAARPNRAACCCTSRRCRRLRAERLAVLRETTDGFVIAERDLELRGPGEVLGTRQTGIPRRCSASPTSRATGAGSGTPRGAAGCRRPRARAGRGGLVAGPGRTEPLHRARADRHAHGGPGAALCTARG
jgi:ATP-dependent DNA helicase RecG